MTAHHRSPEWQRTVRANRSKIAATLPARCIDCCGAIRPGDRWQVGHRIPVVVAKAQGWTTAQINDLSNLGPTHAKAPGQRACNQIAGGEARCQEDSGQGCSQARDHEEDAVMVSPEAYLAIMTRVNVIIMAAERHDQQLLNEQWSKLSEFVSSLARSDHG